jgi:hypothetical protein
MQKQVEVRFEFISVACHINMFSQKVLDLNNDGKVDVDDLKYAQKKVLDVLGYNMPAGGGMNRQWYLLRIPLIFFLFR